MERSKIRHGREYRKRVEHALKSSARCGSLKCRHEAILIPTPEKSSHESSSSWKKIFLSGQSEAGWGLCSAAGDGFFGNQWREGRQTSIKETTGHCPDVATLHTSKDVQWYIFYHRGHDKVGINQEKKSEKATEEVAHLGVEKQIHHS